MAEKVSLDDTEGLLFSLKNITYKPEFPRKGDPFIITGEVELFNVPFVLPVWIIATVVYPEKWWEEIIPIWGSPEVRKTDMSLGGKFEIKYGEGFDRDGEYSLAVRLYPGPTIPIGDFVFPPAPAASTYETTFLVEGVAPPAAFRFAQVIVDGNSVELSDHDADAGLLLTKQTSESLSVNVGYEWTGHKTNGVINVAAGHKDWAGGFTPKSEAVEQEISLPESMTEPYLGTLETPIVVPLTECAGLTDGAIEVVFKIAGAPDYITHIWNVYATELVTNISVKELVLS